MVSAWKMEIKASVGELDLPDSPEKFVTEQLSRNALDIVPIYIRYVLVVYGLPDHHRDPFDRLLIAQAVAENGAILTADPLMTKYPVQTV